MKLYPILLLLMVISTISHAALGQNFSGSFAGTLNGVSTRAELKPQGNTLKGVLSIDGKPGQLTGQINGNATSGSIIDDETGAIFTFTAILSGDDLNFKLSQADVGLADLPLAMKRVTKTATPATKTQMVPAGKLDARLFGTWRYTEVLSTGGYGDNFSMSTDNFLQLNADGSGFAWTGSSAGGSADVSFSSGAAKKNSISWYTQDNKLYFKDPSDPNPVFTLFSVDDTRLMLHNGGNEKKVYQHVQ